jgi:hypothetical protein
MRSCLVGTEFQFGKKTMFWSLIVVAQSFLTLMSCPLKTVERVSYVTTI